MNATRLNYGLRISGDHPRYCPACGTQRATERGRFVEHQTPQGKRCANSGVSVKAAQSEAAS